MIRRTFRSAPVIGGRVQGCVAMFRRAIGGEAEAHAKAKSEWAQGQNRGTRNHHKAIEPKTHGDVTKKPESRGEVIRMGRASLVDDPGCGAAQGKKDFEAELAAEKPECGPCGICGKEKDHWLDDCPYKERIPNPLEVTILDGRYGMVCKCCGQPGGHPGRRGWTGHATLKFCSHCLVWGEHWSADCPCIGPDEVAKWRKVIKEVECYCLIQEPEKEFLDLEPYFRAVQRKDEENEYDA